MNAFRITLERHTIEGAKEFSTRVEAEKFRKSLIKKYSLKAQRGFYGNPVEGIKVSKNY
jgi:hypothetical protein